MKDKISVVENNKFGIICLKLDRNLFVLTEDIYIYIYLSHIYIPPVCSKVLNENEIDFLEELENGIEKYGKLGKTFISGDLNSRIGKLSDILESDRYLDADVDSASIFDTKEYFSLIGISFSRNNQDHTIDNNGQKLISLCKPTDHIIANGRLYNDQDGKYTFCSTRGLSVTDYLLININDIESIHNFAILD